MDWATSNFWFLFTQANYQFGFEINSRNQWRFDFRFTS